MLLSLHLHSTVFEVGTFHACYRPRSRGDNTFASVHVCVCVCVSVYLSVSTLKVKVKGQRQMAKKFVVRLSVGALLFEQFDL